MGKVVVKVEDPTLIELGDKILGYRILLDELALKHATTLKEFWDRARELYNLEEDKRYKYRHYTREIVLDDP